MTIYVDESIFPFKGQKWCHLFSDEGKDELDQFAAAIGLEPSWFQGRCLIISGGHASGLRLSHNLPKSLSTPS